MAEEKEPYEGKGLRIGYVRVSTEEQNTGRQEVMMAELNVDKLYIEKASGKNIENRPVLKEMMMFVREGDTVVVESFSRFARNTRDLLELTDELNKKHVRFMSIKENIDTSTPSGKFMMTVFGAMAEWEREIIRQRQREGIDLAMSEGRFRGRPAKPFPEELFLQVYDLWRDGKITASEAIRRSGIERTKFYKRAKEEDIRRAEAVERQDEETAKAAVQAERDARPAPEPAEPEHIETFDDMQADAWEHMHTKQHANNIKGILSSNHNRLPEDKPEEVEDGEAEEQYR